MMGSFEENLFLFILKTKSSNRLVVEIQLKNWSNQVIELESVKEKYDLNFLQINFLVESELKYQVIGTLRDKQFVFKLNEMYFNQVFENQRVQFSEFEISFLRDCDEKICILFDSLRSRDFNLTYDGDKIFKELQDLGFDDEEARENFEDFYESDHTSEDSGAGFYNWDYEHKPIEQWGPREYAAYNIDTRY